MNTSEQSDGFALFGRNLFGDAIQPSPSGVIAGKFTVPPFSVLNAREGSWQDRKRAWISLGIQSEVGRGCRPHSGGAADERPGRDATEEYTGGDAWLATNNSGTSIFDPVLCELVYRWFCPKHGMVLDPFAGGSVRGIVAGLLGYRYHGIDLRPEQIAANEAQHVAIAPAAGVSYVCGDSRERLTDAPEADLIFTCPPYGDLEQYSDRPQDLSVMEYVDFCAAYRDILTQAIEKLKQDRFACVVVGEFRDPKTGFYRGFVPFTQAVCVAAGAKFYNEAILVTAVGSLPIRITKQFEAGLKLGKTHQNVLVFVKGNPRAAADACEGQIELPL